jgi:hypothetical protein
MHDADASRCDDASCFGGGEERGKTASWGT